MRPQVGVGGGGPSPRYDSTDSASRFCAKPSAVSTMTIPVRFGRMWRSTIRRLVAPVARAATTNSLRASDIDLPRITRALVVQPPEPSVMLTGALDDARA